MEHLLPGFALLLAVAAFAGSIYEMKNTYERVGLPRPTTLEVICDGWHELLGFRR